MLNLISLVPKFTSHFVEVLAAPPSLYLSSNIQKPITPFPPFLCNYTFIWTNYLDFEFQVKVAPYLLAMVQASIRHLNEPQPEPTIQPFIARGREGSFAEACLPEHYSTYMYCAVHIPS